MPVLTRDQIRAAAAAEPKHLDVDVPEWGGTVRLRKLSAAAGIAMGREQAHLEKDEKGHPKDPDDAVRFYAIVLSHSIVDEHDALLFPGPEGVAFLETLTFDAQSDLGVAALRFNGMLEEHAEDREKNSTTPPGDSPSTSPAS